MEPVKYLLQIDNLTVGYLSLSREKAEEVIITILDDKEKSLGRDIYPSTFYKSIKHKDILRLRVQRLLGLSTSEATQAVYKTCLEIEEKGLPDYRPERGEFSQEDYDKALKILKEGEPLAYVKKVLASEHAGDDDLLPLPALSICTLGLDIDVKINLQTHGEAGKGKSDLYQTFFKATPYQYYDILTNLSPRAMEYVNDEFVTDKILYFDEVDAIGEDTIIPLRIMTWGKKKFIKQPIALTVKEQEMLLLKMKGKNLAVWMSGTKPIDDNQLLSRFIILGVDASKKLDLEVHTRQKKSIGYISSNILDEGFRVVRAMVTILLKNKKEKVLIPYQDAIEFKSWEDRRGYPIFTTLIMASAKWHRYQRPCLTIDNVNYIFATAEDFEVAKRIYNKVAKTQITKLGERELKILEILPDGDSNLGGITLTQIAERANLPRYNVEYSIQNKLLKTDLVNGMQSSEGWRQWEYWRTKNYSFTLTKMQSPVNAYWERFTLPIFKNYLEANNITLPDDEVEKIWDKIKDREKMIKALLESVKMLKAWEEWIIDCPDKKDYIEKRWELVLENMLREGRQHLPLFKYDKKRKVITTLLPPPDYLLQPEFEIDYSEVFLGEVGELPDDETIKILEQGYVDKAMEDYKWGEDIEEDKPPSKEELEELDDKSP